MVLKNVDCLCYSDVTPYVCYTLLCRGARIFYIVYLQTYLVSVQLSNTHQIFIRDSKPNFEGLSDDFREWKLHEAVLLFQSWKLVAFVALFLCFCMRPYSFSKIVREDFGILSRMP